MNSLITTEIISDPQENSYPNVTSLSDQFESNTSGVRIEIVAPTSLNSQLRDSVYRLRRMIYCDEMNLPASNAESESDSYDLCSVNFLMKNGASPIGTVRFTRGDACDELEIEMQNHEWKFLINQYCQDRSNVCEINRFMLLSKQRKLSYGNLLANSVLDFIQTLGIRYCFVAGKDGALETYYKSFGAKVIDETSRPYEFNGVVLGLYKLMVIDLDERREGNWISSEALDSQTRFTRTDPVECTISIHR